MWIICKLKTLWYTIRYSRSMTIISGHEYVEQEDGTLKCSVCGDISE